MEDEDEDEDVVGGGVLATCFRTVRFGFLATDTGFFFLAASVIFDHFTLMRLQQKRDTLATYHSGIMDARLSRR